MAKIERTYNIPLRKGFATAPRYRKTKKAVIVLKEFIAKHMKVPFENIRLGRNLNHEVWEKGYRHPPHHVKVTLVKDDEGIVKAELFGVKFEEPIKQQAKEEKKEDKKAEEAEKKEESAEEPKEKKPKKAKKESSEDPIETSAEKVEEKPKKPKAAKKAAKE